MYILGIEGGATNTVCVVMNGDCKVLGRSSGSGSNQYLIGIPAVAELIAELAKKALSAAGLPPPPPPEGSSPPVFAALGACMSGFLEKGVQDNLEALFRKDYPWLASHYYIDNDSPGSIYTAAGDAGGCVLIAGTGSMGQFMAPSGSTVNCGGHGHMFGDGAL
jgi:N-acetylglucosamine kinase